MQTININSLILDFDLYPRRKIDSQHAGYMLDSVEAGIELPPVIVDKISKRVIDGFHRVTAMKRFYKINKKEKPVINVILKSYKSEADMFLDAMKYNSAHGRSLDQCDKAHCIIRAEELELTIDKISMALSITVDKYGKLKTQHIGELHLSPHLKNKQIPLKRTIRHLAGKKLTAKQVKANERLSGMNQSFYVNQIIDLLENNLLDAKNLHLMERLERLYDLLKEIINKKAI